MKPLPTTIISGFLGSGKTTLINHILRHPQGKKYIVLVNDFGKINIDSEYLKIVNKHFNSKAIIELSNGCICCSVGGSFYKVFNQVLEKRSYFDHLIIETSGVANPQSVYTLTRATEELAPANIITLIDGINFEKDYFNTRLQNTLLKQILAADTIVINKVDDIEKNASLTCPSGLLKLNPQAKIFSTNYAVLDFNKLIQSKDIDNHGLNNDCSLDDGHEDHYFRWSWQGENIFDQDQFKEWLKSLPSFILRMKGWVKLQDKNIAKQYLLQYMGGRYKLLESEKTKNVIIAIGFKKEMDSIEFENKFKKALLE